MNVKVLLDEDLIVTIVVKDIKELQREIASTLPRSGKEYTTTDGEIITHNLIAGIITQQQQIRRLEGKVTGLLRQIPVEFEPEEDDSNFEVQPPSRD